MNQRIARLWAKALRSGDYKQTTGQLKAGDSYCCLGVLCDIYGKETGKGKWQTKEGTLTEYFKTDLVEVSGMPPPEVRDWVGAKGTVQNQFFFADVARRNDSYGDSFDTIAGMIDKHLQS